MSALQKLIYQIIREAIGTDTTDVGGKEDKLVGAPRADWRKPANKPYGPTPGKVFSLTEFEKLATIEEMRSYAEQSLPYVGVGSSRIVFKLNKDNALKIALNDAGVGQNKAETEVCAVQPDLFAKVHTHDPGYKWLISEFAAPLNRDDFEDMTGMVWQDMVDGLWWVLNKARHNEYHPDSLFLQNGKNSYETVQGNKFFVKILAVLTGCNYMPGDFYKISSWGVVNGHPVVLDSGFTRAVHAAFYAKPTPQTKP